MPLEFVSFSTCRRLLSVALLALGVGACASDKSLVSHTLNNVAARDNGFFLAREKLWATEATLNKGRANDYNRRLPLYPTLDSTTVRATRGDLNDIIKKASLPIQHRPGSDWTDDAYLLVGWARFYKMEFDDAELTFKYVNSTSKDPIAKQESLIGLMRTFMLQKRPDDARAVSVLLDKERGLPQDARELFLTRADYYLQTNEPKEAIPMLERAVPLIPQKNERSRTRYLLAQLYQEQGNEQAAAYQLNQILKHNPPYELDFNTKLLLAEVSDLDQENTARLDKYFADLLKDLKNKEYRDRIYYQQARLAYRQKKYSEALALLRPAAKVPTTSKFQKGYTYLLAGRIYYENLQKYQLAAAYYDSAATALPKDNPLYASVKERADILKDFAKQYTIIQTQDSLQALAQLPAAELDKRLSTYAAAAIEAKRVAAAKALAAQQLAARQQAMAANAATGSPAGFTNPNAPAFTGDQRTAANPGTTDPLNAVASGALWYFDNPTSLASARSEFIRRWGDRKLQDNWRTLNTPSSSPNDPANGGAPVSVTGNDQTRVNGGSPGAAGPPDPLAEQNALAATYRQTLPDTPAKLEASNQQIEAAMYELGGIYKEMLKEKQRGYATYAGEVQRYPQGTHAPDADYLLYLYYKDLPDPTKAAEYAANLQRYFPTSTYARLIADPQYREHERALHNAVAARLDEAFGLYKEQEFAKAKTVVADLERQYPKSDLTDRVAYLKLLLAVRTQPAATARTSVQQFAKDFPDSPLLAQAQALAATYQKADAGQLAGIMASTEKPGLSQFRPGEVENRMRIVFGANDSPYVDVPHAPDGTPLPVPAVPTVPATLTTPAPAPTPEASQPAAPEKPAALPAASKAPKGPVLSNRAKKQAAAAAAKAAAAAGTPPLTAPAATTAATPDASAGTPPATAAPATTTPSPAVGKEAPPAAPAVAYTTQLSAAHAIVLLYPKGQAPVADLPAALTTYDSKFFKAANLQVQPAQDLGMGQEMVVIRALPGAKVAQSYATKLRGPQSPLARLRGQGYQTLIISLANLTLLQQSGGDAAGYQQFYQQVYQ